jgi:CAAX prenyl protease N-terminal, five membrane helices
VLWLMALPFAWTLSERAVGKIKAGWAGNEYIVSSVFMLGTLIFETIKGTPWSMYFTFVIEQRHGFNKQTLGLFVVDMLKSVRLYNRFCVAYTKCVVALVACLRWRTRTARLWRTSACTSFGCLRTCAASQPPVPTPRRAPCEMQPAPLT